MGSRADNKDGSCREILTGRLAGKWRVQFTYEDEFGRTSRVSRVFPSKTQGKDFLRDLRHGAKVEETRKGRDLTLGDWFDWLVLNDWPESLDEKTIAVRVGRFNNHVRSHFGKVALKNVNPLVVRSFYKQLRERGVGHATVQAIKSDLVRVFNLAISPYGRVPMTHANPFRLALQAPPRRDAVALTPEEAKKALVCTELTDKERAMLGVFLLAGLRLSEQMALTNRQLMFEQNLIAVDQAVKLDKVGGQTVGLPKGDKKRLVVMCAPLKALLCAVTAELPPDAFLWSADCENKPKMKKRTYDAWKSIVEKTGLPPDTSPHDCRLSHVNWIEKLMPDVSPTTLKEHVGHAAEGVTEVNYTRPLTPAQDLLRYALEGLFKG